MPREDSYSRPSLDRLDLEARMEQVSPNAVVGMLFDDLLLQFKLVKNSGVSSTQPMADQSFSNSEASARRDRALVKSIKILEILREMLNLETHQRSQLPYDLDRLYSHMQNLTAYARWHKDDEVVEELISLLQPIKEAWDQHSNIDDS